MSLTPHSNRSHPSSALDRPRPQQPVDFDRILDEQAREGLRKAYEAVGKDMIEEAKNVQHCEETLNKRIDRLFDQAKENGDNVHALEEWREKYKEVFMRSNLTAWAFNQISWEIQDIRKQVSAGEKMTEKSWVRTSFHVKERFQPPNKSEGKWWEDQISSGIKIFDDVLKGEMYGVQLHHKVNIDPSTHACTIHYPSQLREALGPWDEGRKNFGRKSWLKRDHELRVLQHLRLANIPMVEGSKMLPLFDIETVKRRILAWKPPSILLPRKVEFQVVARKDVFAEVKQGPGGWEDEEESDHA